MATSGNVLQRWGVGTSVELRSLGILSDFGAHRDLATYRLEMAALCGGIARKDRKKIAEYLRSGTVVFAIMEHTTDVLNDRFGVDGGSAIDTDGTYYWRPDTAWYVEEYGISLPNAFLAHAEALQWRVPAVTEERILEIDTYLYALLRRQPG